MTAYPVMISFRHCCFDQQGTLTALKMEEANYACAMAICFAANP